MSTVDRWQRGLADRVGMDEVEIKQLHDALLVFCRRHDTDPDAVLANWQDYPQLMLRRRPVPGLEPDLAVESFLIHNGVMVFGDLVCVPGARRQDLADQGARFVT